MKQTALLILVLFLITSTVAALTLINSCGTDVNNLTDTVWKLNANLTSTSTTCLDLNTSNVDIDCNGFTIGNTNSTLQQIGVNVSATNVTLHGCTITGFDYFDNVLFVNYGKALQVNASNFTMYNSTLDNAHYFIYFGFDTGATKNHTFYNLTFINQSGVGQAGFKSAFGSDYLSNSTFYSLHFENTSGQSFSIQNTADGIRIFNSTFVNISNDVIVLLGDGVQIYNNTFDTVNTAITTYGADVLIYDNQFINVTAAALMSGNNSKAYRNTIQNVSSTSGAGLVAFGPNQQMFNNTFTNMVLNEIAMEFNLHGALSASSADNLTTYNNVITNVTFGLAAVSNSNVTSINDTHINPVSYEYITVGGGMLHHFSNITIINSTFRANASSLNVTGNGSITVMQLVNLTIYNMSTPVVNEEYFVLNNTGDQLYTGLTNTQGRALFNLTLLTADENGVTNHTPHNFTYDNGTAVLYNRTNVTYQNTYFVVTIGATNTPTTQCTTLSTPNTVTTLTTNESVTTQVCFNVTAQNIQINCNGYYLNSAGPNAKYAIFSNSTNTTITNCNFRDYSANTSGYAAYSEGANFTIYNSTFYNSSGGAYAVANYANFTNNTFVLNNATAIYTAGANTTIQNNLIYNTSLYGSAVTIGDQTNFINNNITLAKEVGQDEFALVAIGTAINITSNFIDSQNLAIYGNIAHYINISNNTLNSSLGGILINAAEGAYVSNNTFLQCGNKCVTLRSNDLAFITKNTFTQKSTQGDINFESTNNTNASLNTFQGGIGSISYNFTSARNNTVYSENLASSATPFYLNYSSNVTAINTSFTQTGVTIDVTSNLTIKQPLNISTINSTNSLPATNVNITNGTMLINATSDSNGQFYANVTTLIYIGNSSLTNYSQINVTAYKTSYTTNSTMFNLNSIQNGPYQTITIELAAIRPSVTFVNPENNSNLSSTINLNATITTTLWISTAQFNISNNTGVQLTLAATNTSTTNWNTTLNTTALQDGNYTITIITNDSSNNINNTVNLTIRIDNTKPNILNLLNGTPDTTTTTITWDTNEPANSTITYGTTTLLGSSTTNNTNTTSHSIPLTGLTSSTTYYYNVTSCDLAGNCNTTGPYNFNTTTPAVSSSGGGGSNDFHDKNGNTTNITNLIIQNNTIFKTSSTRNQTPDAPLNKPIQETTQQEETRQAPASFPYELIILLILLLAIATGAYKLYQNYTAHKSTSKLVEEINKSYEQPTPQPQPSVQTMTRPIPPQIVQPTSELQIPTKQQPNNQPQPTSQTKKPSKIELYSQLPEIHPAQQIENQEIDWNIDENDKLDLNIQQKELSLSQKAINKIKKIFK